MQNKHMNTRIFLAVSALYFQLSGKQAGTIEDENILELIESINEYIPAITPEQPMNKILKLC